MLVFMPRTRSAGGIVLLALAASGCGLASATPQEGDRLPADPTRIEFADPAALSGLKPRVLSGDDAVTRRVRITYPELPGAAPLNEKLREDARRRLREFRERTRGLAGSELIVDWRLTSAGETFGVRLRAGRSFGTGWDHATTTYWYD